MLAGQRLCSVFLTVCRGVDSPRGPDPLAHRVHIVLVDGLEDFPLFVLGFATSAHGELYVLANSTGTLAGRTGVLAQVVAR
jgi:hypothetical protein